MMLEPLESRVLLSAAISGVAHFDPHFGPFGHGLQVPAIHEKNLQVQIGDFQKSTLGYKTLTAPAPGDANADGVVNFADFVLLSNHFGQAAGWLGGDFNGTGITDFSDYILLSNAFGTSPVPNAYDGRVAGGNVWFAGPIDSGPTGIPASPLFTFGGPTLNDPVQGLYADCWLFASLSSIAGAQPAVILAHVAMDAGGGVVVNLGAYQIHEPLALPTWAHGSGGEWPYYIEEAESWYRTLGANPTYSSLNQGNPTEIASALGITEKLYTTLGSTPTQIVNAIVVGLAANKPEQVLTVLSPTYLVGNHAYSVTSAWTDATGTAWVELRNPWGFSDATLPFTQMLQDAPWSYIGI